MTLLDDIDDEELTADSWALRRAVSGYDYRVREQGVETDRQIREKIGRDLRDQAKRIGTISERLYEQGDRDLVDAADELQADIERVRQRIVAAPAGGGAVRDLAVDEQEALIALVEYDASLVGTVEEVADRVDRLQTAVDESGSVASRIRECDRAVADLDRAFTKRQDHMKRLDT